MLATQEMQLARGRNRLRSHTNTKRVLSKVKGGATNFPRPALEKGGTDTLPECNTGVLPYLKQRASEVGSPPATYCAQPSRQQTGLDMCTCRLPLAGCRLPRPARDVRSVVSP
jgi:hypothetical protein